MRFLTSMRDRRWLALIPCVAGVALTVWLSGSNAAAQGYYLGLPEEPACQSLTPASAGGPLPRNQNLMVLRFLGVANYELTYRGQVILLDAGIDLLPWWAQTGLTRDQITNVDGISSVTHTANISGTRRTSRNEPVRRSWRIPSAPRS